MRVVPEALWTDGMRDAARRQESRGRQAHFFTGEMEVNSAVGPVRNVRGVLSADGKDVWIQADNELVDVQQLEQHEDFHALVREDPGLVERLRDALAQRYGDEQLEELARHYVEEYGWTNLSDAEIYSEILADAYAGIDIFDYLWAYEGASRFRADVREATEHSRLEGVESVRGPTSGDRYSLSLRDRDGTVIDRDVVRQNAANASRRALGSASPFSDGFMDFIASSREKTIRVVSIKIPTEMQDLKFGKLRTFVRNNDSLFRGKVRNIQTENDIVVGRPGLEETATNAEKRQNATPVFALAGIHDLLAEATLLGTADTVINEAAPLKGKNSPTRLFQYIYVAPFTLNGAGSYLAIMRVDVLDDNLTGTVNKFYNLNSVEIEEASGNEDFIAAFQTVSSNPSASCVSIADLAGAVNQAYVGNHANIHVNEGKSEFSTESSTSASREKSAAELRRENAELRRRVEHWRNQLKVTEKPTAREEDVRAFTRKLLSDYSSALKGEDARAVETGVRELWEFLRSGDPGEIYAGAKDRAVDLMRQILESAEIIKNDEMIRQYGDLRQRLKDGVTISEADARNVSPEWAKWRSTHLGVLNASINGKGTPVDVLYQELSAAHPDLFPADITHPADQLARMAEIGESLLPVYENPFDYNMAEALEYSANSLLDSLLPGSENSAVRDAPPTYADRMEQKLADQKQQARDELRQAMDSMEQKLADQKRHAKEALQKARDNKKTALERYRQQQRDIRERAGQRREERAARQKLLDLARRMKRMKTTAVSRAMIDNLIGQLDTVAVSITDKGVRNLEALRQYYYDAMENNEDFIPDPAIQAKLERLSRKQISELDLDDVRDLTEALLNLENEIRSSRKLIDAEDRRDTALMGEQVIQDVNNTPGARPGSLLDKYVITETLSPLRQLRRLTGYVDGDPLYQAAQDLSRGQRTMMDYERRALERFHEFLKDEKFTRRIAGKHAEEIEITGYRKIFDRAQDGALEAAGTPTRLVPRSLVVEDPVTVKITPAMRISLFLHSLNEQNLRHITEGGVTVPDMALYKKGNLAEAYARGETVKLRPSDIRKIVAGMTDQERAFAYAARAYFNGISRDAINAVSEKLKGYSVARVENYFPINTDANFTKKELDGVKFDYNEPQNSDNKKLASKFDGE